MCTDAIGMAAVANPIDAIAGVVCGAFDRPCASWHVGTD